MVGSVGAALAVAGLVVAGADWLDVTDWLDDGDGVAGTVLVPDGPGVASNWASPREARLSSRIRAALGSARNSRVATVNPMAASSETPMAHTMARRSFGREASRRCPANPSLVGRTVGVRPAMES